jgi:hypothetical protein
VRGGAEAFGFDGDGDALAREVFDRAGRVGGADERLG